MAPSKVCGLYLSQFFAAPILRKVDMQPCLVLAKCLPMFRCDLVLVCDVVKWHVIPSMLLAQSSFNVLTFPCAFDFNVFCTVLVLNIYVTICHCQHQVISSSCSSDVKCTTLFLQCSHSRYIPLFALSLQTTVCTVLTKVPTTCCKSFNLACMY